MTSDDGRMSEQTAIQILVLFAVAGIGILYGIVQYNQIESWRDRARSSAQLPTQNANLDRSMNPAQAITLTPQVPGLRWLWDRKFGSQRDRVTGMLDKNWKMLHVMSTVSYQNRESNDLVDSWNDIATYIKANPMCTSVLPASPTINQRRLFMFVTLRYIRGTKPNKPVKGMLEWLAELETVFLLGVLQSQAEAWKVYLDNFRRLSLASPWLKVWEYRPREHLDFLFMPLVTPNGGRTGMMGRFVISFADLILVETTKSQQKPSIWKLLFPMFGFMFADEKVRPGTWKDGALDHKKYCETAPPVVISEQLLLDPTSITLTRALVHKKMIIMDVCKPEGEDLSFDITSSDYGLHLHLHPLLHKPRGAPVMMELVVLMFRKSMANWTQFKTAFVTHISSLRSYIYDNRAQKAMIDTIMSSLKLVHSLGTMSEHNMIIINKFLDEDVKTIDGNMSAFWSWELPPPTLRQVWPEIAHDLQLVNEFFAQTHAETKEWDHELRGMMQMVFSLVSIDEAYRSRGQAASIKRISWITFIFLPLLFAAALFGMNIDILDDNPSWTWYLVVCVPSLFVCWLVWYLYRISDRRREALEENPFKSA